MNTWQFAKQLQYLISNLTWPDVGGEIAFGSVVVTAGPEDVALANLRTPICIIRVLDAPTDPQADEESDILLQRFGMRIIQSVPGDGVGESSILGANRVATSSGGRGLLELESLIDSLIDTLQKNTGVSIFGRLKGATEATYDQTMGYISWRDQNFEALLTTIAGFDPIMNLELSAPGGGVCNLKWDSPAPRFDTYHLRIRRTNAFTPSSWYAGAVSSTNGSRMIAGVFGGRLFISADSGSTWSEVRPAGNVDANWSCVAISADGLVMMGGAFGGRLYKSIDAGANWSEIQPAGNVNLQWQCCAIDSDGSVMLAVVLGGRIYKSIDTGTTWVEVFPAGVANKSWMCCAVDADGSVMLAGVFGVGGRLYKSIDTGANWSEVQPAGAFDKFWRCCALDSDGSVMLVGVFNGRLYRSIDTGVNWSEVQPTGAFSRNWTGCAVSFTNGSVMLVRISVGRSYRSTDTGANWSEIQPAGSIDLTGYSISTDADGSVTLFGAYGGALYVSIDSCVTWNASMVTQSIYDGVLINSYTDTTSAGSTQYAIDVSYDEFNSPTAIAQYYSDAVSKTIVVT